MNIELIGFNELQKKQVVAVVTRFIARSGQSPVVAHGVCSEPRLVMSSPDGKDIAFLARVAEAMKPVVLHHSFDGYEVEYSVEVRFKPKPKPVPVEAQGHNCQQPLDLADQARSKPLPPDSAVVAEQRFSRYLFLAGEQKP